MRLHYLLVVLLLVLLATARETNADETNTFDAALAAPTTEPWSIELCCEKCQAAAAAPPQQTTLLGDAMGVRSALGQHGIKFDASSTMFYQGVTHGGREEAFQFGGRNDYYLTVDGEKAGLWKGFIAELHGETRYGESVNGQTGTLSPPNAALLFPVPDETVTALTQVKFTQFLSENFAVFAGKINIVDTYMHPFAAGKGRTQFTNTAFCLPPILGRPLSAYSTLGAGFAILQDFQPVFTMMVYDPFNSPTSSGFDDFFTHGAGILAQVNIPVTIADRPGHQGLTFAWNNRTVTAFEDPVFVTPPEGPALVFEEVGHTWAVMYGFDQYLFVDPGNPQRGWGVFGQLALSDGNPNPIRWSATFGIGGSSPLKSRPLDTFGAGYYFIQDSSDLRDTLAPLVKLQNEQGVELYYNTAVKPWFHVTPSLQVLEPSAGRASTATVVGVRTHIDF